MPSVHKAEPHDHAHAHGSELSETELRVRALETILTEKGYVEPAALDRLIETYETKVGPRNGARVVARAWSNPRSGWGMRRRGCATSGCRCAQPARGFLARKGSRRSCPAIP